MGDEYRFEKLNAENYRHWSMRAQGLFEVKGCWGALDPGYGEEMTAAQMVLDHKAKSIFYMIVNDESLDDIAECESAHEIWQTLKEIHTKYETWHGLLLLKDFVTMKKGENETVAEYLNKRSSLYHKVSNAGFDLDETAVAGFAVLGLPTEYEYLTRSLRIEKDDLTMKSLKAKLIEEERRILANVDKTKTEESKALVSNFVSSQPGRGRGKKYFNQNKTADPNKRRDFQSRSGGTPKDKQNSHEDLRCFRCLEFGHIGRDCPYSDGKRKSSTKLISTTTETNEQILKMLEPTLHQALGIEMKGRETYFDIWIVDSGATDHMTSERNKFDTFQEENSTVEVAGGGILKATGRGSVTLKLDTRCGGNQITLVDTLFVPELNGNLVSTSKIAKTGCCVIMNDETVQICKNKEVIAIGTRERQLYHLYEQSEKTKETKNVPSSKKVITKRTKLWHRRFGHLHITATEYVINQDVSKSLTDEETINSKCETCLKGKLKCKPFPKKSQSRENEPLRLIHSDVVGPLNPISKGGNKYFVTFIDDHSRHTEVHMMQKKLQVREIFDAYRRRVENYHGKKIISLRSDNGGEYVGNDFKNFLQHHGIDRQLTIPGTPQQNGVAERANQTLVDTARCMLLESGMPTFFWADAVATACYVRNICPTQANDGKTPLELWKGKKPDISHLRVFGCEAWAVNKKRENKFSPKGKPCVFIGYDGPAKAYRLYDIGQDEVFISRDVKFEEDVFPFKAEKLHGETQPKTEESIWHALDIEPEKPTAEPNAVHEDVANAMDRDTSSGGSNDDDDSDSNRVDTSDVEYEKDEPVEANTQENKTSRSGRRVNPPIWTKDYKMNEDSTDESCCNKTVERRTSDPTSAHEALSSNDSEKWKDAMKEEVENLIRNETFKLVKRPVNRKLIRGKWIFKTKYNEDGELVRHRARIVALGNTQTPGIDYDKTYAPVVLSKTNRILFGIAAERNWKIHHLDITAAYLIADLDEDVFMEIPEYFDELKQDIQKKGRVSTDDKRKDQVWKLRKSIYGLHQSGRQWNRHLDTFLQSQGLTRSLADPCLYYYKGKDLIITTYVDDLVLYGRLEEIERIKKALESHFDIKDLGEAKHILSMRVRRTTDSILLDQTTYVKDLLNEFGMLDSKPVATPLCIGTKYKNSEEGEELELEKATMYRRAIGSLLYLATQTRPDLAFSAAYLSQFNQKPSQEHWTGMKHVLRYLNGTKDMALEFQKTNGKLQVFGDADWGSDPIDRRSFSGYVITIAGAAISWASRKQRCTALSTVEAEFVALSEVAKESTWIRSLLEEIGQNDIIGETIQIQIDNQGAMKLAENPSTSDRTKHIDLKLFHVRELIEDKKIRLTYVNSGNNIADQLTKIIPSPRMNEHLGKMGIVDPGGVLEVARDFKIAAAGLLISDSRPPPIRG